MRQFSRLENFQYSTAVLVSIIKQVDRHTSRERERERK